MTCSSLHSLHIEDIPPIIKDSTADLRQACLDGIDAVQVSIDEVNACRWCTDAATGAKYRQKFDASIAQLSAAMTAFKDTNHKMLIEPFMPLLTKPRTKEAKRALPLRPLYLSYVFATNLIVVGDSLLSPMDK
jgi:hypothetical protein